MAKNQKSRIATQALCWNIERSIKYFDLLSELQEKHEEYIQALRDAKSPADYPPAIDKKLLETKRAVRDALVVRVAAIFEYTDTKKNLSLSAFLGNGDVDLKRIINKKPIVKKIIKDRHSFTAHMASRTSSILQSGEIIESDLRDLLVNLEYMIITGQGKKWRMSEKT